jgi:hypothetical protein
MSAKYTNIFTVEGRTGVYTVKEEDMKPEVLQDVLKWMYLLKIDNLEQKVSNRILQDVLKSMYLFKINNLKHKVSNRILLQDVLK